MREIDYTAQFIEPCEEKAWSYACPFRWRLIWVGDSSEPTQLLTLLDVKLLWAWLSEPEFSFSCSHVVFFQFQLSFRVWVPSYQEIWLLDMMLEAVDEHISRKMEFLNKLLSNWLDEGNGVNEGG